MNIQNAFEVFRKALVELKAAESLLASELKRTESHAKARQAEIAEKQNFAEEVVEACASRISKRTTSPLGYEMVEIAPAVDESIKNLTTSVKGLQNTQNDIAEICAQIKTLNKELRATLAQEDEEREQREQQRQAALRALESQRLAEQQEAERQRLAALHKQQSDRRRRIIWRLVTAATLLCSMIALHFFLLRSTTLSFDITVDGVALAASEIPSGVLDGNEFLAGNRIKPGRHTLLVALKDCEPYEIGFWTFYSPKDLGVLPIDRSKGWLSVTVAPGPATVVVRQRDNTVHSGSTPLTKLRLPIGNYSLEVTCRQYTRKQAVAINREKTTEANFVFELGSAKLSSDPSDASFELLGKSRQWRGQLPALIEDVEAGNYNFVAERKGWRIEQPFIVRHDNTNSAQIEFQYGSIRLTSVPSGLQTTLNGKPIGKTPTNIAELRPGSYALTVTDGENNLSANVVLAPKQASQKDFVFRYGSAHLFTEPPGAKVKRNGKEIGITPITLERVSSEGASFEFKRDGYITTNLFLNVLPGGTTNLTVKMWNERYLVSMKNAERELSGNNFDEARDSIATALEFEPGDNRAASLLVEINKKSAEWGQLQLELKHRAIEEEAKRMVTTFEATPLLYPEEIITNCWRPPATRPQSNSKSSFEEIGDAARNDPLAVPWVVTGEVLATGLKGILAPTKLFKSKPKKEKPTRFLQSKFEDNYQNKTFRYYAKIAQVDAKENTVTFVSAGKSKQSYCVFARIHTKFPSDFPIKRGAPMWVSGQLSALQETNMVSSAANCLVLDNATVFSPETLKDK